MIFGMSLATFTFVHVLISLLGIFSGVVVVYGMLSGKQFEKWTAFFLVTTVATSVTGFGFPFHKLLPAHVIGFLSLIILVPTIMALYAFHLAGAWRWIYVIGALIALYFNVFVLIVQTFLKVPVFNALAPTQSEPPFVVAQLFLLALFIFVATLAVRRSRHPLAPVIAPAR
jgi:hypothetical protein